MSTSKNKISCPHCGKKNTWKKENKFRPFCCERCKLIDLGDWASERFRIESDTEPKKSEDSEET